MKTRAVILAGGEGARLGTLTAKRTKPAVPFAGKYRIIDFALSNCINSSIIDLMILVQYRPQSLIEHIGAGGPWDLNRDFSGGVSIYTPYKARNSSDWYLGTADAVQQNFLFIKRNKPDYVLILSGDHIYSMDYAKMIAFHQEHNADLTIATIEVPAEEASRYGILGYEQDFRVVSFVEKPDRPPSNRANMGVYLFSLNILDRVLWEDHLITTSNHDFGKDILPRLVEEGKRVFAYPYEGYWMDVGTVNSYWQAHMDLLKDPPALNLNDRSWIVRTRTEAQPPARIADGARIINSMVCDGCVIAAGAIIDQSVLSPGVRVGENAVVRQSIILTENIIGSGASIERTITDKRVQIGANARVGAVQPEDDRLLSHRIAAVLEAVITMIGKNSIIPDNMIIEPGAIIGPDVIPSDYVGDIVRRSDYIQTRRFPYEI